MPGPFDDWLIYAINSQLRHKITGWDEKIVAEDDDFEKSILKASSLIRIGLLILGSLSYNQSVVHYYVLFRQVAISEEVLTVPVDTYKVKLSDDLVKLLDVDKETLPREVYKLIIFELFREGRISSGKGAELLGVSRSAFLELLIERKIPFFNYSKEDFQEEYEAVKQVRERLKEETS